MKKKKSQQILQKYKKKQYEQLYAYKFDNLEEMDIQPTKTESRIK